MVKSGIIWFYTRLMAIAFAAASLITATFGYKMASDTLHLLSAGQRAEAVVIELVERPSKSGAGPQNELPASAPVATVPVAATPAAGTSPGPADAPAGHPSGAPAPTGSKADAGTAAKSCVPASPRIRFDAGNGKVVEAVYASAFCPHGYTKGQKVEIAFDPQNTEKFEIIGASFWSSYFGPVLFTIFSMGALGAVFVAWPRKDELSKLAMDPAMADVADTPDDGADAASLFPGLVKAKRSPLAGIVASASLIKDGKYPLELCEFTAYMAALAYHEPLGPGSKQPDPRKPRPTLVDFLTEKFATTMTHVTTFSNQETEGFGFVMDGTAFIVLRGTVSWADWRRNLRAQPTGPNQFLPRQPGWQVPAKPDGWTAPERHRGFAEGFDVIRDQIEAWVATLPQGPRHPFVFAGHSLGGALSFLGAWEFATRGREVAAVITFGAAVPGWSRFKSEYDALGLTDKTLRLEFSQDIVPEAQKLIGYREVGRVWEPQQLPLVSGRLALAALPLNWVVGALRANITFGGKKDDETSAKSSFASSTPPLSVQRWAIQFVMFLAFSGILALAAHQMQRRYALALSIMSYRRIRARRIAAEVAAGRSGHEPVDFEASYDDLRRHLVAIRGVPSEDRMFYASIHNLPRRVEGPDDLKWLNAFHRARIW